MSTSKKSIARPARPPQPASERRSAEAALQEIIAKHAPAHAKMIASARRSLRKRLPGAYEVVYEYRSWLVTSFSPTEQGYQGVLALRADAEGVKLYFNQGKQLPDPKKLLNGSAQTRWIALESASTLTRPAVVQLIGEAIARSPVPFEPSERGPLVIRSASSKAPRRRARS